MWKTKLKKGRSPSEMMNISEKSRSINYTLCGPPNNEKEIRKKIKGTREKRKKKKERKKKSKNYEIIKKQ